MQKNLTCPIKGKREKVGDGGRGKVEKVKEGGEREEGIGEREDVQTQKTRLENRHIKATADYKSKSERTILQNCMAFYINKFENLEETDDFLGKHKSSKWFKTWKIQKYRDQTGSQLSYI